MDSPGVKRFNSDSESVRCAVALAVGYYSEGREAAVPEPAVFAKLRAFRVMHSGGPDAARPLVEQALDRFRSRHLLYFLEVLAAKAWLEKLINDSYLSQTLTELGLFDRSGAHGLKAKLAAEGFLVS